MSARAIPAVCCRGVNDTEVQVLDHARAAGIYTTGWCAGAYMTEALVAHNVTPVIEFCDAAETDMRCAKQCIDFASTVVVLHGDGTDGEWMRPILNLAALRNRRVRVVRGINDRVLVCAPTAFFAPPACAPWVWNWIAQTFAAVLEHPVHRALSRPWLARPAPRGSPGASGLRKSTSM